MKAYDTITSNPQHVEYLKTNQNHNTFILTMSSNKSKLDNLYYKPDDTVEQLEEKLVTSYELFNDLCEKYEEKVWRP